MLKIHETHERAVGLSVEDGDVRIRLGDETKDLPPGALDAVMKRYGLPLERGAELVDVGTLELGEGRLRHARHLARYDVIAKDYLVYERPNEEALCALATTVAGALEFLAR